MTYYTYYTIRFDYQEKNQQNQDSWTSDSALIDAKTLNSAIGTLFKHWNNTGYYYEIVDSSANAVEHNNTVLQEFRSAVRYRKPDGYTWSYMVYRRRAIDDLGAIRLITKDFEDQGFIVEIRCINHHHQQETDK